MMSGRCMDTGKRWTWFKIHICHCVTLWLLQVDPWISLRFSPLICLDGGKLHLWRDSAYCRLWRPRVLSVTNDFFLLLFLLLLFLSLYQCKLDKNKLLASPGAQFPDITWLQHCKGSLLAASTWHRGALNNCRFSQALMKLKVSVAPK